jgi:hypothetical protein
VVLHMMSNGLSYTGIFVLHVIRRDLGTDYAIYLRKWQLG